MKSMFFEKPVKNEFLPQIFMILTFILTGISFTSAQINNSLYFDSDANVTGLSGISPDQLTIEFWIYPNYTSGEWQGIYYADNYSTGGEEEGVFLETDQKISYWIEQGTPDIYYASTNPLNMTQWNHVAFTYDGSTLMIYLDGVLDATHSSVSDLVLPLADVTMGYTSTDNSGGDYNLGNSALDELRIWNTVRSATEIQNNKDIQISTSSTGLVRYYQFNEGVGGADNTDVTSLPDETNNGTDGTLNLFTLNGTESNWISNNPINPEINNPDVTTANIINTSTTSAIMGGEVTNSGGATVSERGVVYSSTDTSPEIGETGVTKDNNGNGIGSFSETISGLTEGETYYVRAYAINSNGTEYGEIINFDVQAPIKYIVYGATTSGVDGTYIPNGETNDGQPVYEYGEYYLMYNSTYTEWAFVKNLVDIDDADNWYYYTDYFDVSPASVWYESYGLGSGDAPYVYATAYEIDEAGTNAVNGIYTFGGAYHDNNPVFINGACKLGYNATAEYFEIVNSEDNIGEEAYIYYVDAQNTSPYAITGGWETGSGSTPIPSVTETTPIYATWDGSTNTDWNTATNWIPEVVPTTTKNVIIPDVTDASNNFPVIGTTANCYNLGINSGASLTIASGGSLITIGTITNNGTFNAQRTISNEKWHLISSPVNNAQSGMFSGDFLQDWDETTANWIDIPELDTPLTPGKGFGFWSNDGETTHTFTGTPNNGTITHSVSFTEYSSDPDAFEGTNVIGNPYPSSIDWDDFDNDWGAVYIWNPNYDNGDGTYGKYISWINGSGSNGCTQFIAPMQAFFVVVDAEDDGTDINLTNANRTHSGASTYYKSEQNIRYGIILESITNGSSDELIIKFNANANQLFEKRFDAYKFFNNSVGSSQLFSITGAKYLSIDVRPESDLIQLGLRNQKSGTYKIGIKHIDGISSAELEDTKLNTFHDLSKGAYEFDWNIEDSEERFILHLKATATQELEEQEAQVYSYDGQVYIRQTSSKEFNSVAIYDLAGRVVYSGNLGQSSLQSIDISSSKGVYLVQLIGENASQTSKVNLK